MNNSETHVCPVQLAGSLDNKLRKLLQNPYKVLSPYVTEGMKVLDVGCGPGFFSIELAKLVGAKGKVLAADLQEGMLQKIRIKIKGTELENRIEFIRCGKETINVFEKVDFINCFYMLHEVPAKNKFFSELKNILVEKGQILIVEPSFHVTGKEFMRTMEIAAITGFKIKRGPKLFLSRSSVLTN